MTSGRYISFAQAIVACDDRRGWSARASSVDQEQPEASGAQSSDQGPLESTQMYDVDAGGEGHSQEGTLAFDDDFEDCEESTQVGNYALETTLHSQLVLEPTLAFVLAPVFVFSGHGRRRRRPL